jgi:cell division protein FtsL
MMMRIMMVLMIMIMISGILSVWKQYFWVNNLG